MISISDNSASNMLIEAVGLEAVNGALRDLGATTACRGASSIVARRCRAIRRMTARPRLVAGRDSRHSGGQRSSCEAMLGYLRGQSHSRPLARRLPESVPYAGKTGGSPARCSTPESSSRPLAP
ncbi:MAG: serine hydrolase [Thermomicrobiales bacterium]